MKIRIINQLTGEIDQKLQIPWKIYNHFFMKFKIAIASSKFSSYTCKSMVIPNVIINMAGFAAPQFLVIREVANSGLVQHIFQQILFYIEYFVKSSQLHHTALQYFLPSYQNYAF